MKTWWERRKCKCNGTFRFVVFQSENYEEDWFIAGFRCEACGNWKSLSGPHKSEDE